MAKAKTQETGAPVAAPTVSSTEIATRLEQERLPRNWWRLFSSVVTGTAALLFGLLTVSLLWRTRDPFAAVMMLAIFGGMTTGFSWLTWRWARSLPPARALASPRERDELDS
jgi:hypothetical protein